jgi:hypothetical protein
MSMRKNNEGTSVACQLVQAVWCWRIVTNWLALVPNEMLREGYNERSIGALLT